MLPALQLPAGRFGGENDGDMGIWLTVRSGKRGATPKQFAPLFDRPGISAEIWCRLVKDFGKLFSVVAGQPQRIDEHRSKGSSLRYRTRQETRELLASV